MNVMRKGWLICRCRTHFTPKLQGYQEKLHRGVASPVDRVLHAGGIGESVNNLAEAHCEELNRPVRTHTPGGVGGAISDGGPYPISASWLPLTLHPHNTRDGTDEQHHAEDACHYDRQRQGGFAHPDLGFVGILTQLGVTLTALGQATEARPRVV